MIQPCVALPRRPLTRVSGAVSRCGGGGGESARDAASSHPGILRDEVHVPDRGPSAECPPLEEADERSPFLRDEEGLRASEAADGKEGVRSRERLPRDPFEGGPVGVFRLPDDHGRADSSVAEERSRFNAPISRSISRRIDRIARIDGSMWAQ